MFAKLPSEKIIEDFEVDLFSQTVSELGEEVVVQRLLSARISGVG